MRTVVQEEGQEEGAGKGRRAIFVEFNAELFNAELGLLRGDGRKA